MIPMNTRKIIKFFITAPLRNFLPQLYTQKLLKVIIFK
ncbi:hypothetical protein CAMRE0001_1535 [Campylobacter rectus RM3267]|uniref:Uncharacterized protein n=1 Tax=Campylobacter rectus RM3267 TaxID=553218 RepID=B9CZH6_CAMRE|nr:hypothetical protein CAMRE0001_1535 [Campylobacter rectus RM3267]